MFHESFRNDHSFDKRVKELNKILTKYPDRIPVILSTKNTSIELKKHKYLVPKDITFSQFAQIIRTNLNAHLNKSEALFYFIGDNSVIPNSSQLMAQLYTKYKSDDFYLVILVDKEATFG